MQKISMKEFIKNNKKEIMIGAGLAIIGGVCGWVAYDRIVKSDNVLLKKEGAIKRTLKSAVATHGDILTVVGGHTGTTFKIEDLGKVGEMIIEDLGSDGDEYTHILIMGKDNRL